MNKNTNSVANIGVVNITTMGISKLVTFAGATLVFIGMGGILLSNKTLTEPELNYLREHVNMK